MPGDNKTEGENASDNNGNNNNSNASSNNNSEDKEFNEMKKDVKNRERLKEALKENELIKIASEKEKKELSDKAASLDATANSLKQKYANAELKAQAIAAGLTDVDYIKMMDTSSLTVDDTGNVKGASEIIAAFKTAKPHLFGEEKKFSSSSNAGTPAGNAAAKKDAFSMTKEEFAEDMKEALQNPHKFRQ